MTQPHAASPEPGEAPGPLSNLTSVHTVSFRAPRTVVVVEDLEYARVALRTLLEMAGYRVTEARDGIEGLELIGQLGPDVAILDIGLPGMDGYELAARVRRDERQRSTILVAMTGYDGHDAIDRAREVGFDHYVRKPVHAEVLSALCARLAARLSGCSCVECASVRSHPVFELAARFEVAP